MVNTDTKAEGVGHGAAPSAVEAPLALHLCTTFRARLRGWHAVPRAKENTGVYLSPCKAVHTFGMHRAIDVVFVDKRLRVLRQCEHLPPRRAVWCLRAHAVIELPAGYCRRHRDFMVRVQRALCRAKWGSWHQKR